MIKTLIQIVTDEAETNEAVAAMLAKFNESYEGPDYAGEMCTLCGVRIARRQIHDDWHRNLSLGMAMSIGIAMGVVRNLTPEQIAEAQS